jgi:hypothetical protein
MINLDPEDLFAQQLQNLKEVSCPEDVVNSIADMKEYVLKKAESFKMSNGNISFLAVVPVKKLPLLIDFGSSIIEDFSEKNNREEPYFIFDVNPEDFLGSPMAFSRKAIREQKRLFLTFDEAVSLDLHFKVISPRKFLISGESTFRSRPNEIPLLCRKSGLELAKRIEVGSIKIWDNCNFCITPTKKE